MNVKDILILGALGGVGAVFRVYGSSALERRVELSAQGWAALFGGHFGTLIINLFGCFAVGVASTLVPAGPWRVLVIGGLLGGLTTFGTFAFFLLDLLERGRWAGLLIQLLAHILGGIALVWLGRMLAQRIVG